MIKRFQDVETWRHPEKNSDLEVLALGWFGIGRAEPRSRTAAMWTGVVHAGLSPVGVGRCHMAMENL